MCQQAISDKRNVKVPENTPVLIFVRQAKDAHQTDEPLEVIVAQDLTIDSATVAGHGTPVEFKWQHTPAGRDQAPGRVDLSITGLRLRSGVILPLAGGRSATGPSPNPGCDGPFCFLGPLISKVQKGEEARLGQGLLFNVFVSRETRVSVDLDQPRRKTDPESNLSRLDLYHVPLLAEASPNPRDSLKILLDGEGMGSLPGLSYGCVVVAAGNHELNLGHATFTFTSKAGEELYIRVSILEKQPMAELTTGYQLGNSALKTGKLEGSKVVPCFDFLSDTQAQKNR